MKISFPRTSSVPDRPKSPVRWPLFLLSLPALVAIWAGWVGLGEMAGFGPVKLLPGISKFQINTAITLPIGLETYAAYSMYAWLTATGLTRGTRRFAMWSAFGSLALGMLGQVSYHLLVVAGVKANHAPVGVIIVVSAIPVLVVGFGIGLAHAMHKDHAELYATEKPVTPSEMETVPDVENEPEKPTQDVEENSGQDQKPRGFRWRDLATLQDNGERYAKGVEIYRKSLEGPGRPLSQRDLADAIGLKNRELARRIISDVRNGSVPSEVNNAVPSSAGPA